MVDKQVCAFLPQLPLCSASSVIFNPTQPTPAGMGWLPDFWCNFVPNIPTCGDGPAVAGDGPLKPLTGFGSNPGNLDAFTYVPPDTSPSPRPLVVALHGCTQTASDYNDETGWVQLADKLYFAMLFPQQKKANNPNKCFNWFEPLDNQRGRGEALSIKQMIDTMLADTSLNVDKQRVYITGLSGGGAMTAVMAATYPEMFAGAAPIAGIPYGCANDVSSAFRCMSTGKGRNKNGQEIDLLPADWGERVTSASPSSTFPRVSIWQGTSDTTVNQQNGSEMIEQWTNVLGLSQSSVEQKFKTTRHLVYQDSSGRPMVEAYFVNNMGHGTPIDSGPAQDQCGKSHPFILEAGICSSFYIAKFWGLTSVVASPPASPSPGNVLIPPFSPAPTNQSSEN